MKIGSLKRKYTKSDLYQNAVKHSFYYQYFGICISENKLRQDAKSNTCTSTIQNKSKQEQHYRKATLVIND